MRESRLPDSVLEVLRSLGYRREEAVYIGDSDVDILTAQAADMDCISVDWGFRDRDFLESSGAQVIVSSATELLSHVLGELPTMRRSPHRSFLRAITARSRPSLLFPILREWTGRRRCGSRRRSAAEWADCVRSAGAVSGIFMAAGLLWGYE